MITEVKKLLLNLLEESTNVESSRPDMTLFFLNLKNGPATFFPPDNSDILSSQPPKEFSLMRNAEKDTSEERSSVSSIDDLL